MIMKNSMSDKPEERPYHHGDLRRALVQAALEIVTEEQDWAFSLRHVARRAGVSHNAPYNHFPEKQNLLAAIAVVGFERLRDRLVSAAAGTKSPELAVVRIGVAYVHLGVENPALYRLMFGSALADQKSGQRPTEALSAGAAARAVLESIVLRGASSGAFAIAANNEQEVAQAALALWSTVHGLTSLIIDRLAIPNLPLDDLIEGTIRLQAKALRPRPRASVAKLVPKRAKV
jgi:AcrR family transcriptional regulator